MNYNTVPEHEIFKNKIVLTIIDPLGNEFDEKRLFSIDAKMWFMSPKTSKIPIIQNIPASNCSIYINEPFPQDYVDFTEKYPTSKCLDFRNLNKTLYGKYGSLQG
jgi:hypothetical protein